MKKHRQPKWLLCLLFSALTLSLAACGASSSDSGETNADVSVSEADSETTAGTGASESSDASESIEGSAEGSSSTNLPIVSEDTENQATYAGEEDEIASQFQWYKWEFSIDADIDTVGTSGDGIGTLYFRLYVPESDGDTQYPLVEVLGGLGSTNSMSSSLNSYAAGSEVFASEINQTSNPCYILNFSVPYEACCNYEAELAYINQFGEIVKWVAAEYGNVDKNRIYATGMSQGAGWSYELAAVQPDLLAAILINAGMTTHSTWADQCDMTALANSDVNIYIWHGYQDSAIPVNEAYRAYNDLVDLGKTNIKLEVAEGGHVNGNMYSAEEFTSYMTWLFEQVKGVAFTDTPELTEEGDYADYLWAGYSLYESVDGWATENDYAHWTEPADNSTWETIQAESLGLSEGDGGTGDIQVGRVRIACELVTTYDGINDGQTMLDPVVIKAGDSLAITMQGYTGAYGDDLDAFLEEWSVDYAVLSGSITNVEVTNAASEEPISRPDDSTASLTNGAGPNVNNSIATDNVLDGEQVYVRIDTAEDFDGETATIALRFTRDLGNGEYASFIHVINVSVES